MYLCIYLYTERETTAPIRSFPPHAPSTSYSGTICTTKQDADANADADDDVIPLVQPAAKPPPPTTTRTHPLPPSPAHIFFRLSSTTELSPSKPGRRAFITYCIDLRAFQHRPSPSRLEVPRRTRRNHERKKKNNWLLLVFDFLVSRLLRTTTTTATATDLRRRRRRCRCRRHFPNPPPPPVTSSRVEPPGRLRPQVRLAYTSPTSSILEYTRTDLPSPALPTLPRVSPPASQSARLARSFRRRPPTRTVLLPPTVITGHGCPVGPPRRRLAA